MINYQIKKIGKIRTLLCFLVFLFTFLFANAYLYAQPGIRVLETAPQDSLEFYVRQQVERLNAHLEYSADSMMEAGVIVYNRGEAVYARKFFEMAYARHTENGNKTGVARANSNIAVMYEIEGQYDKALECYYRSLKIVQSLRDSMDVFERLRVKSSIYNNMGVLYNEMKEYGKAFPYFLKSIKCSKQILAIIREDSINVPDYKGLLEKSYNSLAYSYLDMAYNWENRPEYNIDSALFYYEKSYKLLVDNKSEYQYHAQASIGLIYAKKGQLDKGIKMLEEAYKLAFLNKSEVALSPIYLNLAQVYIQTKQYQKAHKIIEEGIAYNKKNRRFADEVLIVKQLFALQISEGKYKEADVTSRYLIRLNDSLLNRHKKEAIAKQEVIYETEKKEYEARLAKEQLQRKEEQISRQRLTFFAVVLVALLIGMAIAFLVWRNRIRTRNKQIILESRLVRSQINPHFMFNALGAIQAYMLDHKNTETISYLLNFSGLMRNILDSSRSERISVKKEVAIIKDYLSLQQLRFNNKFDFTITVDPDIDQEQTVLPPMLLQPFVENAVEHGVKSLGGDKQGKIDVDFTKRNGVLKIAVKDNGRGVKATLNKNKQHVSHATNITKERVANINKLKEYEVELNIESVEEQGTEVTMFVRKL